jgi:ABC-type transport system involved in multi-copper enzyme maturation permease subunit
MQALIKRELRNSAPVMAVALISYFLAFALGMGLIGLTSSTPYDVLSVPFAKSDTYVFAVMVGALFAIVLGLRQANADLTGGTALFLLHRPIDRRRLFLLKITMGLAVFLVVTAVPLLVFIIRAAVPGFDAAPFRIGMLTESLLLFASLTIVYLASFLSGLRSGAWYGTRLVPIVGALFVVTISVLSNTLILRVGPLVSVTIIAAANYLLIQAIQETASEKEYR